MTFLRRCRTVICLGLLCAPHGTVAWADSLDTVTRIDGFTAPFRSIEVATAETGVVLALAVREGDMVQRGQVLAKLDDDLHVARVAAAKQNMELRGRLVSAQAEVDLRKDRLEKLIQLEQRGSARAEEVQRARTDLAIARGRLLDVQEQLKVRRREYESALVQLRRRTVRAPIDGVVTLLYKHPGEFVGPNDPRLVHIDQLNPLLAVFSAPADVACSLGKGQPARVRFKRTRKLVRGVVEYVAPVVDGKSGTVRVKVRLDNDRGFYLSGQSCTLELLEKKGTKQAVGK